MPFDIQADALYFQARENGASYAIHEERVLSPDFQSHFGARARVKFVLPHDCWEVMAEFLHFHARTRSEKTGISLWGFSQDEGEISNLWRLHMGLADLLLERVWCISPCFSLQPFWGLRYGEIRHKLKQNADISMKNKFWGVGPEVGFEGVWAFCSWLKLYARSAFSLLFGDLYIHQDIAPVKFFDEYSQMKNMLQTALGLRLGGSCVYGQVAFELFLLPGQNQLVRFVEENAPGKVVTNQGDLSLHGLSFGLGVEF